MPSMNEMTTFLASGCCQLRSSTRLAKSGRHPARTPTSSRSDAQAPGRGSELSFSLSLSEAKRWQLELEFSPTSRWKAPSRRVQPRKLETQPCQRRLALVADARRSSRLRRSNATAIHISWMPTTCGRIESGCLPSFQCTRSSLPKSRV